MNITFQQKEHAVKVTAILQQSSSDIKALIAESFFLEQPYFFDFTENNVEVHELNIDSNQDFDNYVQQHLHTNNTSWGIGKYGEDRLVYRNSPLFTSDGEARSVHLAYDVWLPAGSELYAPLDARVHSFQINDNYRDYGPTIILEHEISGLIFYTLYGHLSRTSLKGLAVNQTIKAGERVAWVGDITENGQWPSHVHFQIMTDMINKTGDFPGVAKPSEWEQYRSMCLDPYLLFPYKKFSK
ncbi:MAG: peptidoglycan DD-metalloendopeptidase family protein [bacterium]|nr:peptidoglycan DD-metalloendopeptidase family protein [bacterium]